MLGASDLLTTIRGSTESGSTIKLGTMTGYNTCRIGDQLQLAASQLLFIEQDTLYSGDTVALVKISAGQYLVLGRVVSGSSLTGQAPTAKEV